MSGGDQKEEVEWAEVTSEFRSTAAGLALGELATSASFSLSEAMSAIELCDPKMDAGMVRVEPPRGFAKQVADGTLKVGEGEVSDIDFIRNMDATLGCLVSWLEGASMVQTLYTNLLLHRPQDIPCRRMRFFAFGVMKLVALIANIIKNAGVMEEEDFAGVPLELDLGSAMERGKVFAGLKELEDETNKAFRYRRDDGATTAELDILEGIACRLRFVRILPLALLNMTVSSTSKQEGGGVPRKQNLQEADSLFKQCEKILEHMPTLPKLTLEEAAQDGDYAWVYGFEPGVGAPLQPPTFPRQTRVYNRLEAQAWLLALVRRLILFIVCLPQHAPSFGTSLEFFRYFSRQNNCIFSRSLVLRTYVPEGGDEADESPKSAKEEAKAPAKPELLKVLAETSMEATMAEAIRNFVDPKLLLPMSPFVATKEGKEIWEVTLSEMVNVLTALVQVTGFNRARQREKLTQCIEELCSLHKYVDNQETKIIKLAPKASKATRDKNPMSLRSFVLYHSLQAQLCYLHLGLELSLYSEHEFTYVYWYMGEVVLRWLGHVVQRAMDAVEEAEAALAKAEKNKHRREKRDRQKVDVSIHKAEIMHWTSRQKYCEAVFRSVACLEAFGLLKCPGGDNGRRLRYEHRMKPFANVHYPPFVPYVEFKHAAHLDEKLANGANTGLRAAEAWDIARDSLNAFTLTNDSELEAMEMLAKKNAVLMRLLVATKGAAAKGKRVALSFEEHKHFPCLKLQAKN